MTMVPLVVLQIPCVIVSRDIAANWKWSFGFFFMLIDFLIMDSVLRWISPELRRNP